jgi:uncharacterized protein YjbI with pentapeptide repeats
VPIGRDNPPDLAPEHLGAVELGEPGDGFEIEDGELGGADISGVEARSGRIVHATIEGLRAGGALAGTDFAGAELTEVDLRGSDLARLGGDVASLRGAIVDSAQLIDLAPRLAAAAGLRVEDS